MRSPLTRIAERLRRGSLNKPESPAGFAGLSDQDRAIVDVAGPHTMTGPARLLAVADAARHCADNGIPGAFVECGVWRGGSVLAMILALQQLGRNDRDIYLYDTFEGMTKPSEADVSSMDPPALETWNQAQARGDRPWQEVFGESAFGEAEVRKTLLGTGYPPERIRFVVGPVERTLPADAPEQIAVLRLDTDWYESTRHELHHLYPRLADGGVLIVDDYGHWEGCRRAVDEYFRENPPRPLLCRIDYTGRIGVKP